MAQSVSLSFRVSSEKAAELDKLAEATERPKSWLLEKALDSYLEEQAWQIEHIKAGIKAADEGRVVSNEDAKRIMAKVRADILRRANRRKA